MTSGKTEVLLVGCGKMGGALLAGWLKGGAVDRAVAVDPGPGPDVFAGDARVTVCRSGLDLPAGFAPDVVVIAVKPQMMADAAPVYRDIVQRGAVVLSIAAGKTIAHFEDLYGAATPVVRAMPNTPAAIGRGISVAVPNARVTPAQRALCDRLLQAGGAVEWVDDEALIDVVTATSGGGPAYVFLLIESLAAAGVAAGLPADLAMKLARTTVSGAGELARQSSETAEQLRKNVTSPNGTTQAALGVLMAEGGVPDLMVRAIAAATRRSRELAD
ncbi:pyrroline-5-carboxylate reductase [Aliidongia dinghuensis]|uniref:Pyrroline-5-carboxylate reductase n=1 Tax=Aliidongia dinghuensis TaxID=1867774 RepID=A0A8J3E260_9PROT|nr:pyrroline-5-carboxylate reductase [Aliidongia dinghuensis]GGF08207.1 pyrroline-5-carboxylate reductase [Aliidongia dinghuensis]